MELTATEYELLRLLSVNAGRVVHFDTPLRRIWDGRDGADADLVWIFVRTCERCSSSHTPKRFTNSADSVHRDPPREKGPSNAINSSIGR